VKLALKVKKHLEIRMRPPTGILNAPKPSKHW
jgi:hypothetical protein